MFIYIFITVLSICMCVMYNNTLLYLLGSLSFSAASVAPAVRGSSALREVTLTEGFSPCSFD
jgi:hypothetical protein